MTSRSGLLVTAQCVPHLLWSDWNKTFSGCQPANGVYLPAVEGTLHGHHDQLQEQHFMQFVVLYYTTFAKGSTELQLWTSHTPSFLSARANAQMVVSMNVLIRISAPCTEIMVMGILVTMKSNLLFFSVNS